MTTPVRVLVVAILAVAVVMWCCVLGAIFPDALGSAGGITFLLLPLGILSIPFAHHFVTKDRKSRHNGH